MWQHPIHFTRALQEYLGKVFVIVLQENVSIEHCSWAATLTKIDSYSEQAGYYAEWYPVTLDSRLQNRDADHKLLLIAFCAAKAFRRFTFFQIVHESSFHQVAFFEVLPLP